MNPRMFAQVALGLKFLDVDRRSKLTSYFYNLPETKKLAYIKVISELAEVGRDSMISFFDFSQDLAYQLRDSPPETHRALLDALVLLSRRYNDPHFLSAAIEVFLIWTLPEVLQDRAFTDFFSPCLNHRDESVRNAALRRIGSIVRYGAVQNNPSDILQLVETLWENEALSTRTRSAAIFALDGLTGYDEESTGYRVSKLVSAALRSEESEFRHEAVVLIAKNQGWKIAHNFRQDALHSLLRILKEERDLGWFLVTAFERVPGQIPEWAQRQLIELKNDEHTKNELLRRDFHRKPRRKAGKTNYDIAISFAGEDRPLAEHLAERLVLRGLMVFYDDFEKAELWGKDLFQHLQTVYRDSAHFCVVLISKHYTRKPWTKHELRQAQERALKENSEYILPVRLDDTDVPGLAGTISYLDARSLTLDEIADFAVEKVHAEE